MVNPSIEARRWDRRAARYDRLGDRLERLMIGESRRWIGSRTSGRTLDVAAGTGRTFAHYPAGLTLTAIDLSPKMLAQARRRAPEASFVEGQAEQLPFPDAAFDTVVCTLAVCAVADRSQAVAEMWRVLRPGGTLLLLDHWEPRWRHGRPAELAERQGFTLVRRERLRLGLIERLEAVRPAA